MPRQVTRVGPRTKSERRRLFGWLALLGFTPVCVGVAIWAAVSLNGSYPTVAPPVPRGWQAVPGIYASFSAPKSWALQDVMSDASGDVYYSGRGGAAGESVTQADKAPSPYAALPAIIESFLGSGCKVTSVSPTKLRNAAVAWDYHFSLAGGSSGMGILAWVRTTQSEVWLVTDPVTKTSDELLSTLTLAS